MRKWIVRTMLSMTQTRNGTRFSEETLDNKTQLSFEDEIEDEDVFESTDEEQWADDAFHRVDFQSNLVSRQSLLTAGLNQNDKGADCANMASRSTPALSRISTPSLSGTSLQGDRSISTLEIPSIPIAMNRTQSHDHTALPPGTTRMNMVQSELSKSVGKAISLEHQRTIVVKKAYTLPNTEHSEEIQALISKYHIWWCLSFSVYAQFTGGKRLEPDHAREQQKKQKPLFTRGVSSPKIRTQTIHIACPREIVCFLRL